MAVMKNKTVKPKPASAADFRKADIASTEAFNKAAGINAPTFVSSPKPAAGNLSGFGMSQLGAMLKALGIGTGGGGGGGMSAADRANLELERRKLRMQNRQFGRELGLKQEELGFQKEQFATQQKNIADTLARQQGNMDKYIAGIEGQIQAGPTNRGLYDTLAALSKSAQGDITSSYDALVRSLGAITNPFAGYEAQAVSSPTAGLEQFLSSQGVGTDDLTRFAQLQQAQSQQQAQAANNLMAQLGGIFAGGQQSRLAEAAMGRTADTNALAMNRLLAEAQLGQQGQGQMDELRKLLLQAQMQKAGL